MGISYIEMNEQKIPIEDEELRGVVPTMQEDIDLLKSTVGYSKKNLIPYPYPFSTPFEDSGFTWSYDNKGVLTVNGTATNNCWYNIIHASNKPLLLKKGKYILNGCAINGSNTTYRIELLNSNFEVLFSDIGNGCEFTLEEDTNVGLRVYVFSGTTLNNLIFKPMIRYASIEDDTYEPYVADVQTQINDYEEFGYWTPNATTFTADRCYYIKTKKMLTVWFCFYPSKNVTSEEHYTVCLDIKKTFGINNFKYGFNTCYNSNNKLGFVTLEGMSNVLKVNKLADDLFMSYAIYGQVSCYID